MKHTFFAVFIAAFGLYFNPLSAQGISFEHGTWEETLAKAEKEGKLVFLDAYTSWCGPCKMMSRNTFPDSAVGAFFNEHFVSAKIDMEKGEGPDVAARYGVNVYPTLIFTDAKGEIVHRAAGYFLPEPFIGLGQNAINPETQLATLRKLYDGGESNPVFLQNYLDALSAAYDPQAGPVANRYLATQTDFGTDDNMLIIARHTDDPKSNAFKYLVEHQADFDAKFGKPNVDARIQSIFEQYLQRNPEMTWEETEKVVRTTFPKDADMKASLFKMSWYSNRDDVANYLKATVEHFDRFPSSDPDQLNETAWIFYKNTADKKQLKKALAWAEKSVELHESYYNTDTAAALLSKLGEKKKAIKMAERAIELAKTAGEDYSATQLLLDQLKK